VADELTLTVTLRPAALDARRGIVRMHPEVMAALAILPGDPVRLTGRRTTAGVAARAETTASRALLYADDLTLGNLGMRDGGQVAVASLPVVEARRVTLAGSAEIVALVSPEMLRLALLGKVVTAGDDVSLLPQDVLLEAGNRSLVEAARRSLANRVGYGWTSALLTVVGVDDTDAALVTMDTVIGATNRPDLIDPALLRPGRLERLVYVPPPDGEARTAILRASAKAVPLDESVDLAKLGADLAGFSAADCAALIRESALAAMRDSLEATTVTAANVEAARERVRPSLDPGQVAWLEAYASKHRP